MVDTLTDPIPKRSLQISNPFPNHPQQESKTWTRPDDRQGLAVEPVVPSFVFHDKFHLKGPPKSVSGFSKTSRLKQFLAWAASAFRDIKKMVDLVYKTMVAWQECRYVGGLIQNWCGPWLVVAFGHFPFGRSFIALHLALLGQ